MSINPIRMKPHPDVLFVVLDGEAVLLHTKSEEYYSLDETSTRMWELLVEYGEVEAVITRLLEEFAVEETAVRADLNHFIAACQAENLLIVDD
jgi:hypothetical protein